MFLAIREMLKEKRRYVLVISIVVLISYLVYFLIGLAYGLAKDNTSEVERWNAHSILLSAGTNRNILSSQFSAERYYDYENYNISSINIARAVGYLNGNESPDTTENIVLVGLPLEAPAYPKVIEGRLPENNGEVIASVSLKEEQGLSLGDTIKISSNDNRYTIVGFTEEAKFSVAPVIYTDLQMASQALMLFNPENQDEQKIDAYTTPTPNIPERISGIIVHDENELSSNEDLVVIDIQEFITALPGYMAQLLTFGLMIGFLVLIASIVLGVFMYIITNQKRQTFAIMKIQGISSLYIGKSVFIQTLLVNLIGLTIGLALTFLSELLLPASVPFRSNIVFYGIISLAMIFISLVGSLFSVKSISAIDPLEVLE